MITKSKVFISTRDFVIQVGYNSSIGSYCGTSRCPRGLYPTLGEEKETMNTKGISRRRIKKETNAVVRSIKVNNDSSYQG